jgi:hypothetical protein
MCAKKIVSVDEKLESKQKDVDKIHYLFFQRVFSIQDIETFFKGKYTYNEIKAIIREKYKKFSL